MERVDEHIDKMFSKKFETFETESSEKDWRMLSSKLTRNNFLKFSFLSFNIYYLLVICTFAGTAAYSTINNIRLTYQVKQLQQTIQKYHAKEILEGSTLEKTDQVKTGSFQTKVSQDVIQKNHGLSVKPGNSKDQKEVGRESLPNANLSKENAKLVQDVDKVPIGSAIKRDSIQKNSLSILPADTTSKNKVRKVRKTIVVKPTHVVVKDTVRITKHSK